MFTEYPNAKCGADVNYQSVGSGAGINNLLQNIVQFGATDAPMTDAQLAKSTHGTIIHVPATIGAVAISYNLAAVSGHLNLTGPIVADIYQGTIKFWDDAQIKALNSGVNLPHQSITVVHRSDGSGTTGIFTHYLAVVSPNWQSKVGAGTTVNWPTGVGGKGNAGVAAQVKSTTGSIGYNELAYVLTNNIQYAAIKNANGKYVLPSVEGAKADADNVTTIPADLRVYIVNAPGDTPIRLQASAGRSSTRIRRMLTEGGRLRICSGGSRMMASNTRCPSTMSRCQPPSSPRMRHRSNP